MRFRDRLASTLGPVIEAALTSKPSQAVERHLLGALRERRLDVLLDLLRVALEIASPRDRTEFLPRLMALIEEIAPAAERREIHRALERHAGQDPASLPYAVRLARSTRAKIERHRGSLEGARILELGPGHSMTHGLLLHAFGAERYAAVDLFPVACSESPFYQALRDQLAHPRFPIVDATLQARALERFDQVIDLSAPTAAFPQPERLGLWSPVDACELPFADGSFDVVISIAAFEHFAEPARAIAETARVLAPGGLGLHQIDMRDHRAGSDPHDFLEVDAQRWHETSGTFSFTNRRRASWFETTFQAHGFDPVAIESVQRAPISEDRRRRLDLEFRDLSLDDLAIVSALFVTTRS